LNLKRIIINLILKLYSSSAPKAGAKGFKKPSDFKIVITTFERRFFSYALPLITLIRKDCDAPIYLVINGNFDGQRDHSYYQEFVSSINNFPDVYPVTFSSFRGWSCLINTGIDHADSEFTIVLNDDVYVNPDTLGQDLLTILADCLEQDLVLINGSWSHFAISRHCLNKVGWFDEYFLGIGEEDGDFEVRFQKLYQRKVNRSSYSSFINFVDSTRDENIAKGIGKYSLFNSVYSQVKNLEILKAEAFFTGTVNEIDLIWNDQKYRGFWRQRLQACLSWDDPEAIRNEILGVISELRSRP
jgi:hypothetical protein